VRIRRVASRQASRPILIGLKVATSDSYHFISELMDVFLMAGVHQQPEQSNYLAGGQTLTCKLVTLIDAEGGGQPPA